MSEQAQAFQDLIPGNHCFGCGPANSGGLRIKSYWQGAAESVCHFTPAPHHCAAPPGFLNGGIIATVIDCHAICTAVAYAYRLEGREIGEGQQIQYVTGKLEVSYRKPVPLEATIRITAVVEEGNERKLKVVLQLLADGECCAVATVIAVRVDSDWAD